DGDRMLRTPTYHVFDLYQSHQGGASLRTEVKTRDVRFPLGDARGSLPALSASASVKNGRLTLSVVNAHASLPMEVEIELRGGGIRDGTVHTLTSSDLAAHNTFENPDALVPTQARLSSAGSKWMATLPPASVTVLLESQ